MEKGILRVERGIVTIYGSLAVPFVSARLGENFDTAVADFVVLGGKRVLIDSDFADGGLGGQLSGRKAVDVELAAVWARGGAGECGQVALQFVGIIGKRFEFLTRDDDCARIV